MKNLVILCNCEIHIFEMDHPRGGAKVVPLGEVTQPPPVESLKIEGICQGFYSVQQKNS